MIYTLCSIRKPHFKISWYSSKFLLRSGSLTVSRVIIQQILSEYLAGTVPGHSWRWNMGDMAPWPAGTPNQLPGPVDSGFGPLSMTKSIQDSRSLWPNWDSLPSSSAPVLVYFIPAQYSLRCHTPSCPHPSLRPSPRDLFFPHWGVCGLLSSSCGRTVPISSLISLPTC